MNEKIIAEDTIVNLFKQLVDLTSSEEGVYDLFVTDYTNDVLPDTLGAIVFTLWEDDEDDVVIKDSKGNELTTLGSIDLIQHVIEAAREAKPDVSWKELIEAYLYYLSNDGFMPFENE